MSREGRNKSKGVGGRARDMEQVRTRLEDDVIKMLEGPLRRRNWSSETRDALIERLECIVIREINTALEKQEAAQKVAA